MWDDIKLGMAITGYIFFLVGATIILGAIIMFVAPYVKTPLGALITGLIIIGVSGLIIFLTSD